MATLVCLVATTVLVLAELRHATTVKVISKATASLAFVAAAVSGGAASCGPAGRTLLLALVASVVGDLALLSRDRRAFLGGLGAFLLAHLLFLATFAQLRPAPGPVLLASVAVAATCVAVWRWLEPHVGAMRGPVLAYVFAIGAMTSVSFGAVGSPGGGWVALAAVVFLLSDLCVARDRFVAPGVANRVLGLPLYYVAQLLFAWAVPRVGG